MRVAPIGGYFAHDLDRVIDEARLSAAVTHAHEDGQAGAIAVALAAAVAWRMHHGAMVRTAHEFFTEVLAGTPSGPTRDGIQRAAALPIASDVATAVAALGNGSRVVASDTVPFSLWCAARHLNDFAEALWTTVAGLGDRDTTCAIVGGIVALSVGNDGVSQALRDAREPLDALLDEVTFSP
jgi:ADP-ribosylglycohydrolase